MEKVDYYDEINEMFEEDGAEDMMEVFYEQDPDIKKANLILIDAAREWNADKILDNCDYDTILAEKKIARFFNVSLTCASIICDRRIAFLNKKAGGC